ncbi:MAG: hypothetical protein R3E12_11670 [Candidatus Eisenbacteria bacterium]
MNPYSKTITTMVALGGIALAAGLSLVACEGNIGARFRPWSGRRALDVALGQISIYEGDHFYTVRQQPWSLYAWLDAVEQESGLLVDRTSGDPEAPLIDLRQPRKNADTEPERTEMVTWSAAPTRWFTSVRVRSSHRHRHRQRHRHRHRRRHRKRGCRTGGGPSPTASSKRRSVRFPPMASSRPHSPRVDRHRLLGPADISCFRGLAESVSFDLEERDGRWTPRVEPGAVPIDPLELTRSAFEGRPLPRLFPLEIATGHRVEDWADGPIHLQALDLSELQRSNLAGSPNVWVEVDLDYFGTVPPLASAGYLALSDESDYGVGLLGPGAPSSASPRGRARSRAHEVARAIKRIAPGAVVLVESPEWMQADIAPDVESILRGDWTAADSSATGSPRTVRVPR